MARARSAKARRRVFTRTRVHGTLCLKTVRFVRRQWCNCLQADRACPKTNATLSSDSLRLCLKTGSSPLVADWRIGGIRHLT